MDDLIKFNIVNFWPSSDLVDSALSKRASIAFDMTVINMYETVLSILESIFGGLSLCMGALNKVCVSIKYSRRDVVLEDDDVRVLDGVDRRLEERSK